jgi:hypothetical protein
VVVPGLDITFQLLDGTQAAARSDELQALHAEVYANPPYARADDAALFADRFRSSAASRALSWLRPAMAIIWSATRPGCRCGRPPRGGGT